MKWFDDLRPGLGGAIWFVDFELSSTSTIGIGILRDHSRYVRQRCGCILALGHSVLA
jgi:hypothetical protein